MRPRATLTVMDVPALGPEVKRFQVQCPASVTGLTHLPVAALGLTDEALILAAAYAHEERCGACDVGDVLDQGDQRLRAATDRTWAHFQQARARAYAAGRRN